MALGAGRERASRARGARPALGYSAHKGEPWQGEGEPAEGRAGWRGARRRSERGDEGEGRGLGKSRLKMRIIVHV